MCQFTEHNIVLCKTSNSKLFDYAMAYVSFNFDGFDEWKKERKKKPFQIGRKFKSTWKLSSFRFSRSKQNTKYGERWRMKTEPLKSNDTLDCSHACLEQFFQVLNFTVWLIWHYLRLFLLSYYSVHQTNIFTLRYALCSVQFHIILCPLFISKCLNKTTIYYIVYKLIWNWYYLWSAVIVTNLKMFIYKRVNFMETETNIYGNDWAQTKFDLCKYLGNDAYIIYARLQSYIVAYMIYLTNVKYYQKKKKIPSTRLSFQSSKYLAYLNHLNLSFQHSFLTKMPSRQTQKYRNKQEYFIIWKWSQRQDVRRS